MYPITFVLGNTDNDSSGNRREMRVLSSHPVEQVREAWFKAVKLTGFDFEEVCGSSYDNALTSDQFKKLRDLTFCFTDEEIHQLAENEYLGVDIARFMDMLLWFICLGNEDMHLEVIVNTDPTFHTNEGDRKKRIPRIGYGLFD